MKNLGGKMNFNFRKGKSGVAKALQNVMHRVRKWVFGKNRK